MYRLQDYADNEIEGVFYGKELQKVHKSDDIYNIEEILAEKKENGKVKVLVKWLGHDKKFKMTRKVSPLPYPKLEINIYMFIPISRTNIMVMLLLTISINIRDEAGDLVAFEHGKVIV